MMVSIYLSLLFFWTTQDCVCCVNMKMSPDHLTVALGGSLTLNCTYNCSTGFVRGCWRKTLDKSGCLGEYSKSSFCTISLHLPNVTSKSLNTTYTCYTEDKDDPQLLQKIERIVLLQLQAQTSDLNWIITPKTETTNASLPAKPNYSNGGEFTGIKVLAAVTVAVAMVLAALAVYLCLNRNRQNWNGKGQPVESSSGSPLSCHAILSPMKGSLSNHSEKVTLRIPTPENESDTEVPYADIMITVRGVSTPELTQVGCVTPGDKKELLKKAAQSFSSGKRIHSHMLQKGMPRKKCVEWWGDDSRSHLQSSRSADRLHVAVPREVSRKMSTNSEYAIITYS